MMMHYYEIYYRSENEVNTVYCGDAGTETEARDECFQLGIEFPQNTYYYEAVIDPNYNG